MKSLNIALPTSTFLPGLGGVEVGLHNIALRLEARGHRAVVVMPWQTRKALRALKPELPYTIDAFPPRLGYLLNKWPWLSFIISDCFFNQLKRRYNIDVWHGTMGYPTGVALVHYAKPRKEPHLIRCAGEDIQIDPDIGYGLRLNPTCDRIIRNWLPRAQKLVATTATMAEEYRQINVEKDQIAHIANGVSIEQFEKPVDRMAVRKQNGIPEDAFTFISVGRNHPKKNFAAAIQAMARLKSLTTKKFALVIVGKDVKILRHVAENMNVSEQVILIEQITPMNDHQKFSLPAQPLVDLYKCADAFILPSVVESFGIVIVEAMAAGLPVIVFDAPGSRDIVRNGKDGILVEANNTAVLSAELYKLMSDTSHRNALSELSRNRAPDFSWDTVVDQYTGLYETVMTEAASAA